MNTSSSAVRLGLAWVGYALFFAASVTCQAPSVDTDTQPKSDLHVLFVGHDPKQPYVNYNPTPEMLALHQERSGAFEALLKSEFAVVDVVFAADYDVAMSSQVDVTIFDAKPKPIVTREESTSGWPGYLPRDFARPVLTIGEVSADLGSDLGLKLDWL